MTNLTQIGSDLHLPAGWEHVTVWISACLTMLISLFHILRYFWKNHKKFQKKQNWYKKATKTATSCRFLNSLCSFLSPPKKRQNSTICRFLLCRCPTQIKNLLFFSHLRQYNKPSEQRLIVRIAAVIPIYALTSAVAFSAPSYSLVQAAIRDMAEVKYIQLFRPQKTAGFGHFWPKNIGIGHFYML